MFNIEGKYDDKKNLKDYAFMKAKEILSQKTECVIYEYLLYKPSKFEYKEGKRTKIEENYLLLKDSKSCGYIVDIIDSFDKFTDNL